MGRYDKLLKPSKPPAPTAQSSPTQQPEQKDTLPSEKKPANPQDGKPAPLLPEVTGTVFEEAPTSEQSSTPADEKPEKYTTRLKPTMIRQIKVYAAGKELKDYEVVEHALQEYFGR